MRFSCIYLLTLAKHLLVLYRSPYVLMATSQVVIHRNNSLVANYLDEKLKLLLPTQKIILFSCYFSNLVLRCHMKAYQRCKKLLDFLFHLRTMTQVKSLFLVQQSPRYRPDRANPSRQHLRRRCSLTQDIFRWVTTRTKFLQLGGGFMAPW